MPRSSYLRCVTCCCLALTSFCCRGAVSLPIDPFLSALSGERYPLDAAGMGNILKDTLSASPPNGARPVAMLPQSVPFSFFPNNAEPILSNRPPVMPISFYPMAPADILQWPAPLPRGTFLGSPPQSVDWAALGLPQFQGPPALGQAPDGASKGFKMPKLGDFADCVCSDSIDPLIIGEKSVKELSHNCKDVSEDSAVTLLLSINETSVAGPPLHPFMVYATKKQATVVFGTATSEREYALGVDEKVSHVAAWSLRSLDCLQTVVTHTLDAIGLVYTTDVS